MIVIKENIDFQNSDYFWLKDKHLAQKIWARMKDFHFGKYLF